MGGFTGFWGRGAASRIKEHGPMIPGAWIDGQVVIAFAHRQFIGDLSSAGH